MERPVEQTGGFDETAALDRARGGDFGAFAQLVQRHEASVFRLARHFTRNDAEAEELLHGTFLDACQDLNRLRDASRFRPWLIQLAVKRAKSDERVEWIEESGVSEAEPPERYTPEPLGPLNGSRQVLESALESLRPLLRIVFILRDMEEIRAEDIASMLDLREPVVRRLLMLARMQLRERLFPPFESSPAAAAA